MSDYEKIKHGGVEYPIGIHDTAYGNGFRLYPHIHREFEFLVMEEGRGLVYIDGQEYSVGSGQAVFVGQNSLHLGIADGREPCKFFALVFAPEFLCGSGGDAVFSECVLPVMDGELSLPSFYSGDEDWQRELVSRAENVDRLNREKPRFYQLSIKAEMLEIWRLALSHAHRGRTARAAAEDEMVKAIEYINAEYASQMTLKTIADRVNLSQSYFCRRFSSVMHMSPFEYLLRVRIDNGCRLLRDSVLSVGEIATLCGFNSFSYFSKKFAAIVGDTPLGYRKLHNGSEKND